MNGKEQSSRKKEHDAIVNRTEEEDHDEENDEEQQKYNVQCLDKILIHARRQHGFQEIDNPALTATASSCGFSFYPSLPLGLLLALVSLLILARGVW